MKHHQVLYILVAVLTATISGCKLVWPITMDKGEFSKIENTEVHSLVLKQGNTVHFGKEGGRFVKTIIKDTVYTGIIGFDTTETKAMNFPMQEIASVQGDFKEVSIPFTIIVVLVSSLLLLAVVSRAFFNHVHL